jgi:hypothetical protein
MLAVNAVGPAMFTVVVVLHDPPAVVVTVYTPAASPVCVRPVRLPGCQVAVYVPAGLAVRVAAPVLVPKQVTLCVDVIETVGVVHAEQLGTEESVVTV